MTRSGRKKGKQGNAAADVNEASRIRIHQVLEDFRLRPDEVLTFEAGLNNIERAEVHKLCRKMGMSSKSSGRGDQRRVSVFKKAKKANALKEEKTPCLTFSYETKEILYDLFSRFPPIDEEQPLTFNHATVTGKGPNKKDSAFCRPSVDKVGIAKKVESYASKAQNLRQIMENRNKLPIASFKDTITSAVASHQVVLISGETGCGKTTQVPQMLLDYKWGMGETCKIVCTQPRRISAISVAERIAYERGENVGDNIGYKIRLETKGGKNSSIMFCTNGILLKLLVGSCASRTNSGTEKLTLKREFLQMTHIIVDEIHERDRFSDIMLAILRDVLISYPNLRLILMSATIDAERFSEYFGGCPVVRVPGFTYPVKSFYLEDVLSILKSTEANNFDSSSSSDVGKDFELTEEYKASLDEAIDLAWSSEEFELLLELVPSETSSQLCNYQHSLTGVSPLMVLAGKGRVGDVCMLLSLGADCHLRSKDGRTAIEWAEQENQGEIVAIIKDHVKTSLSNSDEKEELLEKYLARVNSEHIDVILIERLLRKICTDTNEGAILVFLPGWEDINKIRERLLSSPFFRNSAKFTIISLHSMVPSDEQKKVFRRPPPGSRKIILSTNIAETSVTIDDVIYVIDSGRMKEKNYDPYNNVSTLQSSWISKASAKQREGRAGRCQPGICYHLYSKSRAASLSEFQVPEIKRMPIEELCLQVKLLDPNSKIEDFLQKTLDPPVSETIRNAVVVLQEIGALTLDEKLTGLGAKLGSLPVHPSTGKMLLFAILMNCLDPALTLACASDYRDPFILPIAPDERKRAVDAKAELASLCSGRSDHLIVVVAFDFWRRAKAKGQGNKFCSQYYISSRTMDMLSKLRQQLQNDLMNAGFFEGNTSSCSLNSQDPGILHAVLLAGCYPMVGKFLTRSKNRKCPFVETASGAKVRLHPSSSNFKFSSNTLKGTPIVICDEVTRGDNGMYVRNCTIVGPYPLLLLATDMVVAPAKNSDEGSDEDGYASGSNEDEMLMESTSSGNQGERIMSSPDNTVSVVVDRWLTFELTALDAAQIYCLRERLHAALLFKVENPRKVLPPALGASVFAIACILSYDGLSGVPQPSKSVDSLTSMVKAAVINNATPGQQHQSQNSINQKGKDPNHSNISGLLRWLMNENSYLHDDRPGIKSSGTHPNYSSNCNAEPVVVPVGGDPSQKSKMDHLASSGNVFDAQRKRHSSKRKRGGVPQCQS
ncbi:hypothetical protein Syun_010738 [Stephania yunnanensis]|uniref:RNA helicase n=1 Tax=Stephania yunnanensis TaxID=152371 RepID=A0AAP0KJ62_9MAGN